LGVNYDTCHLAVEYEEPRAAIGALRDAGLRISKLHLSAALIVQPDDTVKGNLKAFEDDVYLHQVVEKTRLGTLNRYRDLDIALEADADADEWRIHFHVPLHSPDGDWFKTTREHIEGVLDLLQEDPELCSHLEMETYTWEVLPNQMKNRDVVDQLVGEYEWTLGELAARGLV